MEGLATWNGLIGHVIDWVIALFLLHAIAQKLRNDKSWNLACNCCLVRRWWPSLLPKCDYFTFGSLLSQMHLSVICNVRASYWGGWNFWQYFFAILCLSHPLTVQNFMEIIPWGTPVSGHWTPEGLAKYSDVTFLYLIYWSVSCSNVITVAEA